MHRLPYSLTSKSAVKLSCGLFRNFTTTFHIPVLHTDEETQFRKHFNIQDEKRKMVFNDVKQGTATLQIYKYLSKFVQYPKDIFV